MRNYAGDMLGLISREWMKLYERGYELLGLKLRPELRRQLRRPDYIRNTMLYTLNIQLLLKIGLSQGSIFISSDQVGEYLIQDLFSYSLVQGI